ncbi:glycosyltransferase [Neobacillus sp. PS3-12]|jgi:processive 1,2-diacylglycerol beta-glucosyltransferase|uniref:MGDG synthase family glycosyltransferase n=1 Tax=Neobacillus sp. PS3-12 TaxID=3070677 RepID=UPI0027E0595C|nr:glycosyltransferase [Neobacillus sp. PS3-12]WML50954.1 glycosyltransferase [Neobacillus sp. PS3-12]
MSINKEKILILTGNYGDGHVQVAQAIYEAIQLRFPTLEPVIIDFMEYTHPYSKHVSRSLYFQGIKKFPKVYGYVYQKTRRMNTISKMMKKIFSTGMGRMLKLIEEVHPTVVVSTFPLAAAVLSKLKSLGLTDIPAITVITDHTDHSCWIYPYTNKYIVGSGVVRDSLINLGVGEERISVTGIPIRQLFLQSLQKETIFKKHNLDPNLLTVLIMGGGCGLIGDGSSTIKEFEKLPQTVQFIIVCGRNEKLQMKLKDKLQNSKHHIHLTGYINNVHELMAVSNLMVTKPGGVSTFEAIAMELPMLLYKPIPGQEQDNAKFLVQSGVAIQAMKERDLIDHISKILSNAELLQQMSENAKNFHPKESAFASAEVIIRTMKVHNNLQDQLFTCG